MTAPRVEQLADGVTLHLGDCRDVLPQIKEAAAVVTDPPYLVSKGGFASNLQLDGGFGGWMKEYGNQGDIVACDISFDEWIPLVFAALRSNAQSYFMSNGRNIKAMQAAAEAAGFRLHTLLVWDKRAALPNKYYQNVTEFALFMFKGRAFTINDPSSKNLVSIFQRDESDHPTEKPVSLMEMWIKNSTKAGETVVDPFMGSGTTGVAAIRLRCDFIGVELDEKYFETACRRIGAALKEPVMFVEDSDEHPQESLFANTEAAE